MALDLLLVLDFLGVQELRSLGRLFFLESSPVSFFLDLLLFFTGSRCRRKQEVLRGAAEL